MFSLLLLLTILRTTVPSTAPNYCAFVKDNQFTCDYSAMATASDRPINFATFDPVPQRIKLTLNGMFPYSGDNSTFSSGFSGINTALFDTNFPGELEVDCGRGGTAYLTSGALAYMGHVQSLKFKNCKTYNIPASAFAEIADLDYLGFENGLIDVVNPNAMAGLTVEKLTSATHSFPRKRGHFEVLSSPFTSQHVPIGLLYSWKNLTSVTIKGSNVNSLTLDVFKYNTNLRHIDLSDNGFTSLPENLFSGLEGLSGITVYNIAWECSCDTLWFVPYTVNNNIEVFGDKMCSNVNGSTINRYYYDVCATQDPCYGMTGVAMGQQCVSALFLTIFVMICAAAIMTAVAMVIIIKLRTDFTAKDKKKRQAVGRWNQILETTMKKKKTRSNAVGRWNQILETIKMKNRSN